MYLRTAAKRVRQGLLILLAIYAALEATASVLAYTGWLGLPMRRYFTEDSGDLPLRFDAIRGYTLSQEPSRVGMHTLGTLEYIGAWKGNNYGFPDAHDFAVKSPDPARKRYAVFGDSFSAGQYNPVNWPDRAEELGAADGLPLDLYNFSVDGGGLANWWSILTRLVEPEGFELDGLVFAVFGDDLSRAFSVMDARDGRIWFGEVPYPESGDWDPARWPKDAEEAQQWMRPIGLLLPPAQFDAAAQGEWPAPFKLQLLGIGRILWRSFAIRFFHQRFGDPQAYLSTQNRMIEDIAAAVQRHGWDVLVVQVPGRDQIKNPPEPDEHLKDFARRIGGTAISGVAAFAGPESENEANWFPYDGHWAQGGSDVFARFVFQHFKEGTAQYAEPNADVR